MQNLSPTCQNIVKCSLHVSRVQGRGLNEAKIVLLGESSRLIRGHGAEMPQVRLVANEHYDNVGVCMVAQLPQPPLYVLVGQMLGDIIDEKGSHSTAVISENQNTQMQG